MFGRCIVGRIKIAHACNVAGNQDAVFFNNFPSGILAHFDFYRGHFDQSACIAYKKKTFTLPPFTCPSHGNGITVNMFFLFGLDRCVLAVWRAINYSNYAGFILLRRFAPNFFLSMAGGASTGAAR